MATDKDECCGSGREDDPACQLCAKLAELRYWCEVCERPVAEKRCPLCGLKARRMREK
jgi:hypothetical protein